MSRSLPDVAAVRTRLVTASRDVPATMRAVMLALVPGTLAQTVWLGTGVLWNVLLAVAASMACEALMLGLRRRPIANTLADGSAALAGWLLALCVTPFLPAWQLVLGCIAAIALAKHVFGGLGHNPFNPAMVGYAVLLVSFPATMNAWPAPPEHTVAPLVASADGTADAAAGATADASADATTDVTAEMRADDAAEAASGWQAISGQTPLTRWQTARRDAPTVIDEADHVAPADRTIPQARPDAGALIVSLAWLAGGLWLLWRGVIAWHIPTAFIASMLVLDLIALGAGAVTPGPALTLLSGSAMLAAFFIATDPVSAAASRRGRLVYAAGIGAITVAIRQGGGWPDGIAFAVLLMNGAVPLIDRLSGRERR